MEYKVRNIYTEVEKDFYTLNEAMNYIREQCLTREWGYEDFQLYQFDAVCWSWEETRQPRYMLKDYIRNGVNKGETNRIMWFYNIDTMRTAYYILFVYNDYALNPTYWEYNATKKDYYRMENTFL